MSQSPYIIAFIGGQGYGKTYLARKIAQLADFTIVSNDQIRRRLEAAGRDSHDEDTVHNIAYRRVAEALRQGKT